jgi:hypothetical protein
MRTFAAFTLAAAVCMIAVSAQATSITDAWNPDATRYADGEDNLYQHYNDRYGTSYTSSNDIAQVSPDDFFTTGPLSTHVTFVARDAGYHQHFGWYQPDGSGGIVMHPVFDVPPATPGSVFALVGGGGTISGPFGFYDDTTPHGGILALSDPSANSDGLDHMIMLKTPDPNTFLLAFEDLPEGRADWDYNDLLVEVYTQVVPEPASMAILGMGIAGMAIFRRGRTMNKKAE